VVRLYYETFYCFHLVTGVLFALFSQMHDYNTMFFLLPPFAGWIVDWILRRYSQKRINLRLGAAAAATEPESLGFSAGFVTITGSTLSPVVALSFPIPFYCFRAAPIILSMTITPVWTLVMSNFVGKLWLRWQHFLYRGYHLRDGAALDNLDDRGHSNDNGSVEEGVLTDSHDHQPDNDNDAAYGEDGSVDDATSRVDDIGQGCVNDHSHLLPDNVMWVSGKVDIENVLSEHLLSDDSAVVACGPERFVDSVRQQVKQMNPAVRVYVP